MYFYYKEKDSTYEIVNAMIHHMNNQPLLQKQKALNELYYTQYAKELDLEINKISLDSNKINDTNLSELIHQKNDLLIKSELNEPFYLLNGENNIAVKSNYLLDLLKYFFYFMFISFTIIIAIEGIVFIKKHKI